MNRGGLPGLGIKLYHPPGPLCAPPRAGNDSGTRGGDVFTFELIELLTPSHDYVRQGRGKEA